MVSFFFVVCTVHLQIITFRLKEMDQLRKNAKKVFFSVCASIAFNELMSLLAI